VSQKKTKKRAVTGEERLLWQKVVKKTTPMQPMKVDVSPVFHMSKHQSPPPRPLPAPAIMKPFLIGQNANAQPTRHNLKPDLDSQFSNVSPNMDKRNFDRLKKGKMVIDGRIDLHGLTQAEAHPALMSYIKNSHSAGRRLVLVITGKGKQQPQDGVMPNRRGVLKHSVPQWLQQPGIAHHVLQVTQAHAKHGGTGAYYVYLRRQR